MAEGETATPATGSLVPRPNGHGALRYGGTNRGGPGRPAREVVNAFRKLADDARELLAQHLDNPLTVEQLVSVAALGAKYGLPRDGEDGTAPLMSAAARRERLAALLMTLSPADRERVLMGTSLSATAHVIEGDVTHDTASDVTPTP